MQVLELSPPYMFNDERVVTKKDIQTLLLNLCDDPHDFYDGALADTVLTLLNDYELDADDYVSDRMVEYLQTYSIVNSIETKYLGEITQELANEKGWL